MTTDANRKTAADLFDCFNAGDIPGALALMTDDATWLIPGRKEDNPAAGTYDKRRMEKLFNSMMSQLKGGVLKMTLNGPGVAEGERLALEAESLGHLHNGRTYNQHYHFFFEFRGGKICAVREYLDTQYVYNVWYAIEKQPTNYSRR